MQAERDADLERDLVVLEEEPNVLHKLFHVGVISPFKLFLDQVQPHRFRYAHRRLSKLVTEITTRE